MGEEAGIVDRDRLTRSALKWVLSHEEVTTVVVGVDNPAQLANSLSVLEEPKLDDEEREVLERIRATEAFQAYAQQKREQFGYQQ